METAAINSHDKLDQLLRDGKISEEEYRRLSRAMAALPPGEWAGDEIATARELTGLRKLIKPRNAAKIGGLCAALGAYFRIDPILVRIGAFALTALALLFYGIGVLLILLYFISCAMLPWDDESPSNPPP